MLRETWIAYFLLHHAPSAMLDYAAGGSFRYADRYSVRT